MKINRFDLISLTIVTIVLLLGAYFRVYNLTIFKILTLFIVGGTSIYYFKNNNILTYLKLGIVVIFIGHEVIQQFYIVLTFLLFNKKLLLPFKGNVKYIYYFVISGFFSYLLNQLVEFNFLSFPLFFATFFLPISLYLICLRYGSDDLKSNLVDYYLKIVLILGLVSLIQFITTGATADRLTGGTTSAHTLGFHLAASFVILFANVIYLNNTKLSFYKILLLLLALPIMYLADAKYLVGNIFLSTAIVYVFFHSKKYLKPLLIFGTFSFLIFGFNYIKQLKIPLSTKVTVDVSFVLDRLEETAKFDLYKKTMMLPSREPLVFLVGSGPGTFLSRAANSRAFDTMEKESSQGAGYSTQVDSKLPSFISAHTSWITHEYAVEYFKKRWFGTLYDYRSSIISLIWEFGIIGVGFLSFFFFRTVKSIKKRSNCIEFFKKDLLFIQIFIVFYLLNAMLAYYFEYPETQILFWMLIGLHSHKE